MKNLRSAWAAARKKLRSNRGESIGEVLISLLISSVALVMLASLIATSTNLIQNSKATMNQYYGENRYLALKVAATGYDDKALEGSVYYFDADNNGNITTTETRDHTKVNYRINSLSGYDVIAFWKPGT